MSASDTEAFFDVDEEYVGGGTRCSVVISKTVGVGDVGDVEFAMRVAPALGSVGREENVGGEDRAGLAATAGRDVT